MSDDRADEPVWEQRFRAEEILFPTWAREAPHRLVFASNETGKHQIVALDLETGRRRTVTDAPVGVTQGTVTPNGADVLWFDDRTGDEVGRWIREPFDGGGEPTPLAPDLPDGWSAGLALATDLAVVGTATDDGYAVHAVRPAGPSTLLHESDRSLTVAAMDRTGRWLALDTAESGDIMHPDVRLLDVASGETLTVLSDGAEASLNAVAFAPVAGDPRLALTADRSGRLRPVVVDVTTGERWEPALDDLTGDVSPLGWWPDGSALLVEHDLDGRSTLLRLDTAKETTEPIDLPAGSITAARVRPDGTVWARWQSGAQAPRVVTAPEFADVLTPSGGRAPDGYAYESWEFRNGHGERVHGFVVTPPGRTGPHPTVLLIHGGPAWLWADAWRPEVPMWVDAGFAVALVNYRGSTGYGPQWRDAIIGRPGFTELEDLMAGVDDLVTRGVADPAQLIVSGGSWGGYLSLLALGRHPDRWAAGIAVVPVADYVAAYEDEAPDLQALDRVLFGGGSDELRALYEECSPLTYVDDVQAPVLIITGANDTRCPIRQVRNYVGRLEGRGHDYAFDIFEAGHGSLVVDERIRHMRLEREFLRARGLLPDPVR